jgi:hypothetical protein
MADPTPLAERLKKGIERIDSAPPQGPDSEAIPPLRKSLLRTAARLAAGPNAPAATFRYQMTGGKNLLFQGPEALPVEPARLHQLLNAVGVELETGESIDVDGGLVSMLLRSEINVTDTNLRTADATLQQLKRKTGHDRDHAAVQQNESLKIRLRSRMTQLVAAVQAANQDAENPAALPDVATLPTDAAAAAPPPPPEPKPAPVQDAPAKGTTVRRIRELPPTPEMVADALWKILEAIDTTGFQVAAIGEVGYQAWDPSRQAHKIEILVSSTASQRETLLAAARAQGFQPSPSGRPLSLRWVEAESNRVAPVDIVEAATPFLKQVLSRAQPREVFQGHFPVVSCEDLVVMFAGSDRSDDRDSVITLLQANINSIDAAYLRKEAQTAGVFEQLKEAWAKVKQQQQAPKE